jgi:hypothetical protein
MEKAVFCGETITLLFSRDEKSNYFAAEKRWLQTPENRLPVFLISFAYRVTRGVGDKVAQSVAQTIFWQN